MTIGQTDTLVFDAALNGVIHDLHDAAMFVPASDFQRWALRELRPMLAASRWKWGVGCHLRDRVHAGLSIADLDTPTGAAAIAGRALQSVVSPRALAAPGIARFVTEEAADGSEVALHPARRLEICVRESSSGLHAFLACARRSDQPPFSLAERAMLEVLAPHMFTAWRHARRAALYGHLARCRAQSAAVVDGFGVVHVADSRFFSLLRSAWPQWSGTRLPDLLEPLLSTPGERVIDGIRWHSTSLGADDAIVLAGTPLGALHRLTPRETRVVARILDGESYGQAAEALGISANTLRNALVRVYRKLGVRNKMELVRRLESA
jgi:DNA-binding CsgD family transcriptional regulator